MYDYWSPSFGRRQIVAVSWVPTKWSQRLFVADKMVAGLFGANNIVASKNGAEHFVAETQNVVKYF